LRHADTAQHHCRHNIPAAVAPTKDGYQLICLTTCVCKPFCAIIQIDKRCSRNFFFSDAEAYCNYNSVAYWTCVVLVQRPIQGAARPGGRRDPGTNGHDIFDGSSKKKRDVNLNATLSRGTNWSHRTDFPTSPSSSWCRSCNYNLAATCTIIISSLLTSAFPL
jgi:hypothetical protein